MSSKRDAYSTYVSTWQDRLWCHGQNQRDIKHRKRNEYNIGNAKLRHVDTDIDKIWGDQKGVKTREAIPSTST